MSVFTVKTHFLKSQPSTSLVGKDVLAFCSRCGQDLLHVVVTVAGSNKPERVQCHTCKTQRNYKSPKNKKTSTAGGAMSDREEELDIDSPNVAKVLLGEPKKKSKAKAKSKAKLKEDSDKPSSRSESQLPLSLQKPNSEDLANYEIKIGQIKNIETLAKPYSPQIPFGIGDVIQHKTFGIGFVLLEAGLNKAEVLFQQGRKLLVITLKK